MRNIRLHNFYENISSSFQRGMLLFFFIFSTFLSAQEIITTQGDAHIFLSKDAKVYGLEDIALKVKTEKVNVHLSGGAQLISKTQISNINIKQDASKPEKTKSNYSKNIEVAKKKKEENLKKQNPITNVVQYSFFKNPFSESSFSSFSHTASLAVLGSIILFNVSTAKNYIYVFMLFFFLCLFYGYKKSFLLPYFLNSSRVRPPPFY